MEIYGSFIHFVGLTMKKQNDRHKQREPPSQRPTKVLSPHVQANLKFVKTYVELFRTYVI